MRRFIVGQKASVEALVRECNRVVFSDTEAIVTAMWCRHFLGSVPPFVTEQVERQRFDLYLLTAASEDWAEEEQRVHPEYTDRVRFEQGCIEILEEYCYAYARLQGNWAEREAQAVAAVEQLLL